MEEDTQITSAPPERSLIAKIFVSPDEPRLRAGWRLLLYLGMLILVGIGFGIVGAVLAVILSFGGGEMPDLSGLGFEILGAIIPVLLFTVPTWIARRYLDRRSFRSLGLILDRTALPDLVFGILLGALLMGLIYAFESAMGWLDFQGWAWDFAPTGEVVTGLLGGLVLFLTVGYYEELFSRGYLLQNLNDGLNLFWALLISSGIFSALHLSNLGADWASVVGIFLAGYFLAYGWIRTRQLWIPIGLHIGWNFFQGTIFGFAVSGTDVFHLIQQTVDGPELITGGSFGPEAGLVGWVAIFIGMGLIWLYTQGREERAAQIRKEAETRQPLPFSVRYIP